MGKTIDIRDEDPVWSSFPQCAACRGVFDPEPIAGFVRCECGALLEVTHEGDLWRIVPAEPADPRVEASRYADAVVHAMGWFLASQSGWG